MRRVIILVLCLFWTVSGFAQTALARKESTFQEAGGVNTKATYADFFKKLMDFFLDNKATPSVAAVLRQLEPYLSRPLTDQDKTKVNKILTELENLKEPDPKTGEKVSILKTRVALGSFVTNLRTEIMESEVIDSGDTTVADGTEVMPDTVAQEALDGVPVLPTKSGDSPWIWWIISGVSILAAAGLGYLYLDEKKKRERIDRQMLNTSSQASQSYIKMQQLEKQVPQLIEKIKEYENALKEYDKALKEAQQKNDNERNRWLQEMQNLQAAAAKEPEIVKEPEPVVVPSQPPQPPVAPAPEEPEPIPEPAAVPAPVTVGGLEVFYLSTPNKDGSFRDIRGAQFDPSQSLYQVRLTGPLDAEFEFVDDPGLVSEALRYPETFLDPVCDYGGGIEYGARRIITVAKGKLAKASVDSDRWELQYKAIIRFEN
ncbi:hypothetical protein BWI93_06375 [Siphonobacter sp. BAB-5385]|uniref:hypothetical protein n=1 Tax=Siphonobacter sp. BAB-5385 TaxID=1864822 RepID=UPI000B9DF08F|nr:hypothetical protein [Siphonobacter sp. BAB-5385]OZI08857.1 hypothetical protein BWI93_06375 [Siphonobacter sp. BAB-5385]